MLARSGRIFRWSGLREGDEGTGGCQDGQSGSRKVKIQEKSKFILHCIYINNSKTNYNHVHVPTHTFHRSLIYE